MIFIFSVVLSFLRSEKIVASDKLKDSTCQTPQVSRFIVIRAEYDFRRTVLSSLNDVRKLIINVTAVSHINKFDTELALNLFANFL